MRHAEPAKVQKSQWQNTNTKVLERVSFQTLKSKATPIRCIADITKGNKPDSQCPSFPFLAACVHVVSALTSYYPPFQYKPA